MDPQTVNLTLSTSGVLPVAVSAYNANTLTLLCEGDLSGGTFTTLVAEIYPTVNLGVYPLCAVEFDGTLGAGPHSLTLTPEQMNLLPASALVTSRAFYLVVRGVGGSGPTLRKSVLSMVRLTLIANPASDIAAPPIVQYAANAFRYIAAAGSTTFAAVGPSDTLTFSAAGGASVSLDSDLKVINFLALGGSPWEAGRDYVANTIVGNGGAVYICTTDHTSTVDDRPGVGQEWQSFWQVGGGSANLTHTLTASSVTIVPSNGTATTIPEADGTNAGVFSAANYTKLLGIAPAATANATNAQLRDRSTHTGEQATSTITGLDTALGLKADLVGGKLAIGQLPDLAIVQYLGAAASAAAMIALVGQRGDWCTRTDEGKTYILTAEPSSTLGNWTAMSYPASPVVSVAGRTGAVTLSSGDISGLGALATLSAVGTAQITDGTVTLAKLANVATGTVFYRRTAGTGAPEVQTLAQLKTDLALAAADITGLGALATLGAVGSAQITDGAVTNAELANMAAATVKGSVAGGVPADLNTAQLTSLINTFTVSASGAVPAATGGSLTTQFLRKDGTWAVPPGGVGGSPGGSSGELQFNNAGAFAGLNGSAVSGSDLTLTGTFGSGTASSQLGTITDIQGRFSGAGSGAAFVVEATGASAAGGGGFFVAAANDGAALASTHRLGVYSFAGSSSSSSTRVVAAMEAFATQAWVDGSAYGAGVAITTTANGTTSRTTKVWVAGNGDVGVGDAFFSASVAPSARLHVRGSGTTTGNLLLLTDNSGAARVTVLDNGQANVLGPIIINGTIPGATTATGRPFFDLTLGTPAVPVYPISGVSSGGILVSSTSGIFAGEQKTTPSSLGGAFAALYQYHTAGLPSGTRLGGFLIGGSNTSTNYANSSLAGAFSTEGWSSTATGSAWGFYVTRNGTLAPAGRFAALWVHQDGNVGVGNTLTGAGLTAFEFATGQPPTARLHARGAGLTTGGLLLAENGAGTTRFAVRDDGVFTLTTPFNLAPQTVAGGLPTASLWTGAMIYVSDASGGASPMFSNGTDWTKMRGTKSMPVLLPINAQFPTSAFATRDTINTTDPIDVLVFPDGSLSYAIWTCIVPEGLSLTGGLQVRVVWTLDTATPSGNVVWGAEIDRMNGALTTTSFAAVHTSTSAANGTARATTTALITVTDIDGLQPGEAFRLRIRRDGGNGSDTASVAAHLVLAEILGN